MNDASNPGKSFWNIKKAEPELEAQPKPAHAVEFCDVPLGTACYYCGHNQRTRAMFGRVRSSGAPICTDCATTMFPRP